MVKSMTGFGRAESDNGKARITVEVRSVNHRYLDLSLKMPRKLVFLETPIRSFLKEYVQRGKLDLFVTMEEHDLGTTGLVYNESLARDYVNYIQKICETFGVENNVGAAQVAAFPEVLTMEDQSVDEEELWEMLKVPLTGAFENLVAARTREGNHLKEDLLQKLSLLDELVEKVKERSPEVVAAYQQKLRAKLDEILTDTSVEEARVAAEVVIFSDKVCNDEETVRLSSHISGMRSLLLSNTEGIGRKLDFLAQEMNREANTILSKSNDIEVSNLAIEIKTEVEKIREQVQNIE